MNPFFTTFFLMLSLTTAQLYGQPDDTLIYKDINSDGKMDTLHSWYDGGSGFGGRHVEIIDAASGHKFALNNYGCFCQIVNCIALTDEWSHTENIPFLEAIQDELLPSFRSSPDPSLRWIIASRLDNKTITDHPYFDLLIEPKTKWKHGPIIIPDNYYITVSKDTALPFYDADSWSESIAPDKIQKGLLVYNAHNHKGIMNEQPISRSAQNKTYTIFKTAHGVVAQKGKEYKWLFISDHAVTGAPEKLRWPSISRTELFGKYVLVEQALTPYVGYRLFIIDIESGRCARLIATLYDEDPKKPRFTVNNNTLFLAETDQPLHYSIDSLMNSFHQTRIMPE